MNEQAIFIRAGAAVVAIIALIAIFGRPEPEAASASVDPAGAAIAPVHVTAAELWAAYDENEAATQEKYGARPLLVAGEVDTVRLDGLDPIVLLVTPNRYQHARVELIGVSADMARWLRRGQQIEALCQGATVNIGIPFLHDCELES